jgi:ubiquinone/menaquinone biosynthesis C-methylase UbiE
VITSAGSISVTSKAKFVLTYTLFVYLELLIQTVVMRLYIKLFLILILSILFFTCSPRVEPYRNGPVMSERTIEKTFRPILEFMEVRPGITFADFGAGSGAITVMMATLMDKSTVYIQDIDTVVLNEANVNKIITYYSKQSKTDLRKKNDFRIVIGDIAYTNLPDAALDLIYSNATIHVLDSPDSVLSDLRNKLKPGGRFFVRDSFKNDHGEGEYCSDKKCAKRLLTIDEFLAMMGRNSFKLIKQTPDLSGYPVFGFERM